MGLRWILPSIIIGSMGGIMGLTVRWTYVYELEALFEEIKKEMEKYKKHNKFSILLIGKIYRDYNNLVDFWKNRVQDKKYKYSRVMLQDELQNFLNKIFKFSHLVNKGDIDFWEKRIEALKINIKP